MKSTERSRKHRMEVDQVKPHPTFTWGQLDAARRDAHLDIPDDPGFTIDDYAGRYGVPRNTAVTQLARLVSRGQLIAGFGTRPSTTGIRRVRTYRLPEGSQNLQG